LAAARGIAADAVDAVAVGALTEVGARLAIGELRLADSGRAELAARAVRVDGAVARAGDARAVALERRARDLLFGRAAADAVAERLQHRDVVGAARRAAHVARARECAGVRIRAVARAAA